MPVTSRLAKCAVQFTYAVERDGVLIDEIVTQVVAWYPGKEPFDALRARIDPVAQAEAERRERQPESPVHAEPVRKTASA